MIDGAVYSQTVSWLIASVRFGCVKDTSETFCGFGASDIPDRDLWRHIYQLAKQQAVAALVWDGVAHAQTIATDWVRNIPADVLGHLFADTQIIESANIRKREQTKQIQSFLQQYGYQSVVLKGTSLAAFYPNHLHRQSADIDLWILPQIVASTEARCDLSEHRKQLISFLNSNQIPVDKVVYHHIETHLPHIIQSSATPVVELHVTPSWLCNPFHNARLQKYFSQFAKQMSHNSSIEMPREMLEVYTLLHAFRHFFFGGLQLRHILDYFLVRRSNRNAGVKEDKTILNELGLIRFASAMDELSDWCFAMHPAATDSPKRIELTPKAKHLLEIISNKNAQGKYHWDYPSETMFFYPWRYVHYLWRKFDNQMK